MHEHKQISPDRPTIVLVLGDFRAVDAFEEVVQGSREIGEVAVNAHVQELEVFLIGVHTVIEWQLVVPEGVGVNLKLFGTFT